MKKKLFHFVFILAVACQSQSPKETVLLSPEQIPAVLSGETPAPISTPPPPTPSEWKVQTPKQLTMVGENSNADFSPDGQKIVFLSTKRAQHAHSQAYELNLTTQKEHRITHQDGWIGQIRYFPGTNKFIYSSTTDEIKENLGKLVEEINKPNKSTQIFMEGYETGPFLANLKELPFEIYLSDLDGSNISRVTDADGFDSLPSPNPKTRTAVFTSFRSGDGDLYQWSFFNRTIQRLTIANGIDLQASYSPDGKQLVWIHQSSPNSNMSSLLVSNTTARQPKSLFKRPAIYMNPTWHIDNKTIVFSSNFEDEKNFKLYSYNLDTKCLKKLTIGETREREPAISPDGKKLLFTSNRAGSDQIFIMDFVLPEPCMSLEN